MAHSKSVSKRLELDLENVEYIQKLYGQDVSFSVIVNNLLGQYREVMSANLPSLTKEIIQNADSILR